MRQLPGTHNLLILSRCKRPEEREFYLRLCVRQRWGKCELEQQLAGALFERTEGPSIGVLLCATKDSEVVEYALSRTLSPALIAEYQLHLPDKKLLQRKLHEFYALAEVSSSVK